MTDRTDTARLDREETAAAFIALAEAHLNAGIALTEWGQRHRFKQLTGDLSEARSDHTEWIDSLVADALTVTPAPDAEPDAPHADLTAPEAETAPEDATPTPEPQDELLCPECGHGIDSHGWDGDYALTCCRECDDPGDCRQAPSDIARELIARATKAERGADPLADEWEAGTDG